MADREIMRIEHKSHRIEDGRLIIGHFRVALPKVAAMCMMVADAQVSTYYTREKSPYPWPKRWLVANPNPRMPCYYHGWHWDGRFYPWDWGSERLRLWFDGNIVDIIRKVNISDLPDTAYETAMERLDKESKVIQKLYDELEAIGVPQA